MTPQELRQELARAIYANARVDYECPRVDDLLPIVWRFAADELRLAARDAEESGRVYVYELTSWLRDRAGVMDGGERR